jgi:hypothetical protein
VVLHHRHAKGEKNAVYLRCVLVTGHRLTDALDAVVDVVDLGRGVVACRHQVDEGNAGQGSGLGQPRVDVVDQFCGLVRVHDW